MSHLSTSTPNKPCKLNKKLANNNKKPAESSKQNIQTPKTTAHKNTRPDGV
jgi:hypothetical protein